ncbi:MAG TPA: hypothetical protein VIF83_04550 [Gemmatimonadaceae bacterium]
MKKFLILAVAFAASSTTASAQVNSQCPPGDPGSNTRIAQDACQKAIDLFQYVAPQLGALLAGGNPTQGLTGTLGGVGHFSVGVRGNVMTTSLPEVDKVVPSTTGAVSSTYPLKDQLFGLPVADVAIGLVRGFDLGLTQTGGVDLLLSGSVIPSYDKGSITVDVPSGSLKLGYGVKLGLLKETLLVPGVSLSVLTRELPLVNITGESGNDRLILDDVRVKSTSWRAVAGKSFLFFGIAGGFGRDSYDSNARISVTVAPRPLTQGGSGGPIALTQKLTRNNVFSSAWLKLPFLRIVGELGHSSGGDAIATFNQFEGGKPNDGRTYFSLGASAGF